MITLDTNIVLQAKYYFLNTKRKNTNAYKSIESYSSNHVAKSTSNTIDKDDLTYDEVIKALNLDNPYNRFSILSKLNKLDLEQLLFLLDKDKLLLGMKFFTKEKIMKFISNLPKEQIVKMLLKACSKRDIISRFPMKILANFLDSKKIEKNDFIKIFESLPPETLAKILEAIKGVPTGNKSHTVMLKELSQMKKEVLADGIKALPYRELKDFILRLLDRNEDFMKEFPKEMLLKPLAGLNKMDLIQSMQVLEPDDIVKMVKDLPKELLSQVVTQLDPKQLGDILQKYFADIVAQIAA